MRHRAETGTSKAPLTSAGTPLADSVTQVIRVEDKFALGAATIRWRAEKDDVLPFLFEPTVLTRVDYPTNALKLIEAPAGKRAARQLQAQKSGTFEIRVQYELPVARADGESVLVLPVPAGLVNRLSLTLVNQDVDVTVAAGRSGPARQFGEQHRGHAGPLAG